MNLVQKLPVALGVAGLMMMSSCSKEDVQNPEPAKNERTDASMRGIPPILTVAPNMPATYGPTGSNILPAGWQRDLTYSNDLVELPTGTSNLTYLFGKEGLPWEKSLQPIPNVPNATSILTISTHAKSTWSDNHLSTNQRSAVETKIKNLKPGKFYSVDFYVASTVSKLAQNNFTKAYANEVEVSLRNSNGELGTPTGIGIDPGNPTKWIKTSMIVEAKGFEQIISFTAYTSKQGEFAYAHIFVDHNSVKEYQLPEDPL
ncbi:hypothetical protein [Dyadobacter psychrophilus]|uniref:Uncharacterized protein n=1 Tax=Dyadobacter psychrophilus TaxID=651661 RepID=A0A1T5H337_9BACT|nr:hypothetical protein [Dyadobacter psychrophilus]SKC15068.1 hypothetical protein SAMN05660293_04783 [Dyadobacter psychrophilus]